MKIIFLFLVFLPLVSFGQFHKGAKYIGGTMTYTSSQDNLNGRMSPNNTQFRWEGQLGIFLNESLSIGPVFDGYADNQMIINPVTNLYESRKFRRFSGGVFARKFFNLTETFLFSLEGKSIVGNVSRPARFFEEDSRSISFLFVFRPVFTFIPHEKWAFDASIGEISYSVNSNHPMVDRNHFMANIGQVRLGVNYFFNRRDGEK
jgi:hypothetical protein